MGSDSIKQTFYGLKKLGITKISLHKDEFRKIVDFIYNNTIEIGDKNNYYRSLEYPLFLFGVEICQL